MQSHIFAHPGITVVTRQSCHLFESSEEGGTSVDVETANGRSIHVVVQVQLEWYEKGDAIICRTESVALRSPPVSSGVDPIH